MAKDILTQLNKLKEIKPDKDWKVSNKEILMNQISSSSSEKKQASGFIILVKELFSQEISFASQPVATFALILLLMLGGGFFSISAASEATPGSFLYTVKLVSEKTQFALTINERKKIELGIKFTERRAKEIESLAVGDEHARIEEVADNLREEMTGVQDRLAQVEVNDPTTALELAKDIDSKTNELRVALKKTKNTLSESAGSANRKIDEATRSVEKTGMTALSTIIKKTDVNDELAQEDISGRVATRLQATKEQIAEVKDETEQVFSAGLGRSDEGIEVYQKPGNIDVQREAEEKTSEASKVIEEAEELLDNNNYEEALEKINESQELIDEAMEVSKKVQEEIEKSSTSTAEVVEEEVGEVKGVIEVNEDEQAIDVEE